MEEKLAIVSFTEKGAHVAKTIQDALGGSRSDAHDESDFSLADWTQAAFASSTALIFVGAAGIAVRAVAPYLRSKATDPAVVCVDEQGRHAIPLLSGHLGGANALAERIAAVTGGAAVITTATDLNRAFAVDLWAKKQGMTVGQPERIKTVSGKILAGETVKLRCPWPVAGEQPPQLQLADGGDVVVDYRVQTGNALQLVPRMLTLGIGCRRGVSAERLEAAFRRFCTERGVLPEAVASAASIDVKRDERGLLDFCERRGWPLTFYSAEELAAAAGEFSASPFVESTVGVDNVCERAALLSSGGELAEKKYASDGVTFALAMGAPQWDWSW